MGLIKGLTNHAMSKYKLPTAFAVHFEDDPVLKQLKEDGEENNRPMVSLFQAATAYLLDSRRYLFIELGRYIQKHGQLPPLEEYANEPATTKVEEEVPKKEGFELKVLPPATEQPKVKFTKTYEDESQS